MIQKSFEDEYWLQREGVRFGNKERFAMIFHTPSVSSLQLETVKRHLFVNLDYFLDHPYINVPYQEDAGRKWSDLSNSFYKKGAERENAFSINIGQIPQAIPRLMLVPEGYKAGYVFTEHADGGNIRNQRAIYFGFEEISKVQDATGRLCWTQNTRNKKCVFIPGPKIPKGKPFLKNIMIHYT